MGEKNMKRHDKDLLALARGAFLMTLICGMAHAQEPASLELITLSDNGLMPADTKKEGKPTSLAKSPSASQPKAETVHATFSASSGSKSSPQSSSMKTTTSVVGTYQVKAGDTLDKVIQKVWPDSLLKPEVLKQAIVEMNPNAMMRGNHKILMAGVTLNLPNEKQIIEAHLSKRDLASEHSQKDLKTFTSYPDQALNTEGAEKRRHWVSYP
jgi:Tfp pilus assembly protein FimV